MSMYNNTVLLTLCVVLLAKSSHQDWTAIVGSLFPSTNSVREGQTFKLGFVVGYYNIQKAKFSENSDGSGCNADVFNRMLCTCQCQVSCSIDVSIGIFGDPCPLKIKHLYNEYFTTTERPSFCPVQVPGIPGVCDWAEDDRKSADGHSYASAAMNGIYVVMGSVSNQ